MKIKYIITVFFFVLIGSGIVQAQNKKIQKADIIMNAGEYYAAREIYIKLYPKIKEKEIKAEVAFKIGLCSRNLRDNQNSILWFRKAITSKYQDPIVNLYMADALKIKGQYEDAKVYYANYRDLVPGDPRGEDGIKSCDLAIEWMKNPTRHIVLTIGPLSSRENDFAPAMSGDTNVLFFTTTRTTGKGTSVNNNSGQTFADVFMTKKDTKGLWSQPVPVVGGVNSPFDDGSCSFEKDGMTIYYTHCPVIKDQDAPCNIYTASKSGDQWGNPTIVRLFSDTSISVGHPFISTDGLTMYFVTDKKDGGLGGKDIWKTTRNSKSDKWLTPQNLGSEINSPYDELYPSVDNEGNLYFATDGRIGMGGLDIYKATPKPDGTWKVENMRYPINSSEDDFAITFNVMDNAKGFFSSARNSGKGDDILSFYIKPIEVTLTGYVINDGDHSFMSDVDVEITGSDGTSIKVKTGFDGKFTTKLRANVDYDIITNKKTFLKAAGSVSTKGITEDGKTFEITLYMKTMVGVVQIPNIRYDFNDTTLREESKVALDELVDILKINPTVKIELRANTDFRGTDAANLKLSQGRANSVVEYLISQGIDKKRLVPKGMGEAVPFIVDALTAQKYPFLKEGDVLSEQFINALPNNEQKEICHELNRRTEFKVISSDSNNFETFGNEK